MIVIRFSRMGKKKQPTYRIVVQEKRRDPWGTSLEILGNYDPRSKHLVVKADRVKHWMSHGAQLSPSVNNLLISQKIIEGKKVRNAVKDLKFPDPVVEEAPAEEAVAPESDAPAADAPTEAPAAEKKPAYTAPVAEETPASD